MRVLFIHDCKMNYNSDDTAQPIEAQKAVIDRYIGLFGGIKYLVRRGNYTSENVICPNFECRYLEDLYVPKNWFKKYRQNMKALTEEISVCDGAVCKMPNVNGSMAARILRKQGKPYLIEVVGCPWDAFWNHSLKGKLIAPLMWFVTRQTVKQAPNVLYVSESFLQGRYPAKGKQISCSDVCLTEFDESLIEERRERTKTRKDTIVIGTVGALNLKYKGQQYVIKAIAKLKNQGYKIKYRLAGGGDNIYLKKLAQKNGVLENVEFLGSLPRDEIYGFMDELDIYIQPSIADATPRALLEAMSRGCAVIGSSTGGIPELVPPECIFKRKNVADLTRVLKKVIDEGPEKWAKENFARAKDFSRERLDEKRREFYKSFIEDAKQ